eukprot:51387_1
MSADQMINILKNDVLPSFSNTVVKNNHNKIVEYFEKQHITGNKLKSIGEKQFTISLANLIVKNNDPTLNNQLGILYNQLTNSMSLKETGDMVDDEKQDNGMKLYYSESPLNVLMKLFQSTKQILNASQILICNQSTTFEEINCLLYRFNSNEERLLYCLFQPEYLPDGVADQVLTNFTDELNTKKARFIVIMSDKNSKWYSKWKNYQDTLQPLTNLQKKQFYLA